MDGVSARPPEPEALEQIVKVFKPGFNEETKNVRDFPTTDAPIWEILVASLPAIVVAPDTVKEISVVEPELFDKPCEINVTHALVPVGIETEAVALV